jgi:hypothetical protein
MGSGNWFAPKRQKSKKAQNATISKYRIKNPKRANGRGHGLGNQGLMGMDGARAQGMGLGGVRVQGIGRDGAWAALRQWSWAWQPGTHGHGRGGDGGGSHDDGRWAWALGTGMGVGHGHGRRAWALGTRAWARAWALGAGHKGTWAQGHGGVRQVLSFH